MGSAAESDIRRLRRWQIAIVIVLYLTFMGVISNRRAVPIALPSMRNDSRLDFTTSDSGALLATGNTANLFGELAAGFITDRFGGRITFLIASTLPALLSAAFTFSRTLPWFALCWGTNRLFMSACIPAMTSLVGAWFPAEQYGRAFGIVSSSNRVGAMLAGVVLSTLMLNFGMSWDQVMLVAAAYLAGADIICWVVLRRRPESVGLSLSLLTPEPAAKEKQDDDNVRLLRPMDAGDSGDAAEHAEESAEQKELEPVKKATPTEATQPLLVILKTFVREPRFWLICFAMYFNWVFFEFDLYVPIVLQDSIPGLEPAAATLISAGTPVGMIIALTGGGVLLDKLSRGRGNLLIWLCLLSTVITVALLFVFSMLRVLSVAGAVAFATIYGLVLGIPSLLTHSLFALRFGGKQHCGKVIAIVDIFGWLGCISLDVVSRAMLPDLVAIFVFLLCTGFAALILMGAFLILDTRAATVTASTAPVAAHSGTAVLEIRPDDVEMKIVAEVQE